MNLTDDAIWNSLDVESTGGTVCSYKFQYSGNNNNVYQIAIKDYANIRIGLYFYSQFWEQIIDYQLFTPEYCDEMKYCQFLDAKTGPDAGLVLSLEDSEFATLNLVPKDPSQPMNAQVEYRLVNRLQNGFVQETLLLLGVGMLLILLFGLLLYKALSQSIHNEMNMQRQMLVDREQRRINGPQAEGMLPGPGGELAPFGQPPAMEDLSEHLSEESSTLQENFEQLMQDIGEEARMKEPDRLSHNSASSPNRRSLLPNEPQED